jgi:hypothetical protein
MSVGPLLEGIPRDIFMFGINLATRATSVVEAVMLSPAVRERHHVNTLARRFSLRDLEIDSPDLLSLQCLLSKVGIALQRSRQKLLILFSRYLCYSSPERLFFSLWGGSGADLAVTLSNAFAARSCVELRLVSYVRLRSADALDCLLLSESFAIDNEEVFLGILLVL